MTETAEYLAYAYRNRPSLLTALRSIQGPFMVAAGLLALGIALGLFVHSPAPGVEPADANLFGIENPTWFTFAKNNLLVVLALVSGAVLLGLPTFITTIMNGVLLGVIVADVSAQGVGLVGIGVLVLPHGIFEIPALLLAASVGLSVPRGLVSYFRGQREQILRIDELTAYLQVVVLAMLLVTLAAWIEANVTAQLYEAWQSA